LIKFILCRIDHRQASYHLQVQTLSESNHNRRQEKGEFHFFIDEQEKEKLKACLDVLETDKKSGAQELSCFFLGGENKTKNI